MTTVTYSRRAVLALAFASAAAPVWADVLSELGAPGTHAVMRHALAPGGGDPPGFTLGNPATQRRLSDAGRAQARATGAALTRARVRFDRVLSSRWDRCLETARLLEMGPVEAEPSLDSFFGAREREQVQTQALRALLRGVEAGARVMLVTHQVNITALTGVFPRSGEVVAFRMDEAGRVVVAARGVLAPA